MTILTKTEFLSDLFAFMQVRILQLMKSKKKKDKIEGQYEEELEARRIAEVKYTNLVLEKVKKLVKQNKLRRVDRILKHASAEEPWSNVIHVKVQDETSATLK